MGGAGNVDLKAAAQGLRLPSPNALGPLPGPSAAFQAPREDWRSKFRNSDSFTSDRGTPVSLHDMPCMFWLSASGMSWWHLPYMKADGCNLKTVTALLRTEAHQ